MGAARFGEGPSARSVWQASKDEAILEAIRVAGEDNSGSWCAPDVTVVFDKGGVRNQFVCMPGDDGRATLGLGLPVNIV